MDSSVEWEMKDVRHAYPTDNAIKKTDALIFAHLPKPLKSGDADKTKESKGVPGGTSIPS